MLPLESVPRKKRVWVPAVGRGISEPLLLHVTVFVVTKLSYEYTQVEAVSQFTEPPVHLVIVIAVGNTMEMIGVTCAPPLIVGFEMKYPPASALKMFVAVLYIAFVKSTTTP